MMFLINNNWYVSIVLHNFGCRKSIHLKYCVMMVVVVVVSMKMEIFRCSKVIEFMGVFVSPVQYVAIRMAAADGDLLVVFFSLLNVRHSF